MEQGKTIKLLISLIIALSITSLLILLDRPEILEEKSFLQNLSPDIINEFSITNAPSYFSSVGEVYVAISSPNIKNLTIELSLDKNNWKKLCVDNNKISPSNLSNFKSIGFVNLNSIRNPIFIRIISGQEFYVNIPKEKALQNIESIIIIKPQRNIKDSIILFIAFITSLGTVYTISNSFGYKKEEKNLKDIKTTDKSMKTLEDFIREYRNTFLVLSIFIIITFMLTNFALSQEKVFLFNSLALLSATITYVLMLDLISKLHKEDSVLLKIFKILLPIFLATFSVWVILNIILKIERRIANSIMILFWLILIIIPAIKMCFLNIPSSKNKK